MQIQCAPACYSCHLIDFETRCPYNASEPTILLPGSLDQLFVRLTTDPWYVQTYAPTIHSMPEPTSANIPQGPWVVTLDNFLTDEEADRLIYLGGQQGYEISMDVGPQKFDGYVSVAMGICHGTSTQNALHPCNRSFEGYSNERRTSTNAWCQDECYNDTLTQQVLRKIENATGVPDENSEYLQLLKYEVGQFYRTVSVMDYTIIEYDKLLWIS
jgi:prolyl 4-hydroxylase